MALGACGESPKAGPDAGGPCPPGTAGDECEPCEVGTYCAGDGAEPRPCGEGEWDHDEEPATACEACEAGSYCPGDGAGSQPCDAGYRDHDEDPATACEACEAGSYCPGGVAGPRACGEGDWDHDGDPATACEAWTDCAEGEVVDASGTPTSDRECADCPEGAHSTSVNAEACIDTAIRYAPTRGDLPWPHDLDFQGSHDGTLSGTGDGALDAIDGFSPTAPATATATVPLEPESIEGGENVRVFAVATDGDPNSTEASGPDAPGPKPVAELLTGGDAVDLDGDGELAAGVEYGVSVSAADPEERTLAITPREPLAPDTTYMVVITEGPRFQEGDAIVASEPYRHLKRTSPLFDGSRSTVDSLSDADAETLEPIRQRVDSQLAVAGAAGIERDDAIASWTFTTQAIGRTIDAVRTATLSTSPSFVDTGGTPNQLTPVPPSSLPVEVPSGEVLVGAITGVPYYSEPGTDDPDRVRTGFWRQADGGILTPDGRTPAAHTTLSFPVLVALPKDDGFGSSDVVIVQHGLGGDRTAMLGIAEELTAQNLAVVAIDLPLHGVTDTESDLYAGGAERTFDVDLVDNDGSSGPDGEIDPSGAHFINLESLLTTRDNLRQATADLFALTRAISIAAGVGADLDVDADADFTNNVYFLGDSLGGVVGGPFVATDPNVDAAVLAMSGGGVAKLLDGSPQLGPETAAKLEARGLSKGTPEYERFLGEAQAVLAAADPINYTRRIALSGTAQPSGNAIPDRNVLALEVVGGDSSPPDQVVPNHLLQPFQEGIPEGTVPSPTAGTDPLVRLMQMQQVDANPAAGGDYVIRYTAGDHASLLDPAADAAATVEMQTNVASFLLGDGTFIQFAGTGTVASP